MEDKLKKMIYEFNATHMNGVKTIYLGALTYFECSIEECFEVKEDMPDGVKAYFMGLPVVVDYHNRERVEVTNKLHQCK